ncbi:MAG: hypothetical protein ACYDBB_06550 [Armatimonadota bacterium]
MKKSLIVLLLLSISLLAIIWFTQLPLLLLKLILPPPVSVKKISSQSYSTQSEKIKVLTENIPVVSEIAACEYSITCSTGGIGPSWSDYEAAVKLKKSSDVDKWVARYQKTNIKVATTLNLSARVWKRSSTPEYYSLGRNIAIVYRAEGIVILLKVTS